MSEGSQAKNSYSSNLILQFGRGLLKMDEKNHREEDTKTLSPEQFERSKIRQHTSN